MATARLIEEEVPPIGYGEPLYKRYVPVVRQFYDSGMKSARVEIEDGSDDPKALAGRLHNAISSLGLTGEVKVSKRGDATYLRRVKGVNSGAL